MSTPLTPQKSTVAQDRIIFFDTTLRDGEQSPGATLNVEQKLLIAQQLARLGVDIIEAGFPFASKGDFHAVQEIAKLVGTETGPTICGLARATRGDIEAAAEAVKPAAKGRIHTFLATSDIHLEYKLRKTRAEVLAIVPDMVAYARSKVADVEFSPEDAGRSDPEFLYQVLEAAIAAGASTVNIPDTVGYLTPSEFGALIKGIKENVPNIDRAIISVHGHNDLGLAVANFLEAAKNGARQMECTINGIGERAGNAALEELVMALHVRRSYFNSFFGRPTESTEPLCNIDTKQIYKTSRLVSNLTGMLVQPNKAIVGANAFAHESGIHQDGVLKNRLTYEIMDAQSIGLTDNLIVLGKLSGRKALSSRLRELGFELSDQELNAAFVRFKEVADKKREISDRDLEAIVNDEIRHAPEAFKLEMMHVSSLSREIRESMSRIMPNGEKTESREIGESMSRIKLIMPNGEKTEATSGGNGTIDAIYNAINLIVNVPNELIEYSVKSVTGGIDALGESRVLIKHPKHPELGKFSGSYTDTDTIMASTKAYLNALSKLYFALQSSETKAEKKFKQEANV